MNAPADSERFQGPCKLCSKPVARFLLSYGEVYFASDIWLAHCLENDYGIYCPECGSNYCVSCLASRNRAHDLTDPGSKAIRELARAAGEEAGLFSRYLITRCPSCGPDKSRPAEATVSATHRKLAELSGTTALLEEAQKAMESGDYDKALASLNGALATDPGAAELYFSRGVIYSNQDHPGKAVDDLKRALELGLGSHIVPIAYKERGDALCDLGRFDEAQQDYSQALLHNPEDSTVFYKRGNAYGKTKDYDQAIADYDRALVLNRDYTEAYKGRALMRTILGQTEGAIRDFDEFLSRESDVAGHFMRGLLHRSSGRPELALADFDRTLSLDPKHFDALVERGNICFDQDRYNQALQDFSEALAINSKKSDLFLKRGNVYSRMERHEEAVQDYDCGLALSPTDALPYYYNRGVSNLVLNRWQRSIEDFTHVLADKPSALAYYNRGVACVKLGSPREAIDDFTKSLALDSKNCSTYFARAAALDGLLENERALTDYRHFLELAPPHEAERIELAKKRVATLS